MGLLMKLRSLRRRRKSPSVQGKLPSFQTREAVSIPCWEKAAKGSDFKKRRPSALVMQYL